MDRSVASIARVHVHDGKAVKADSVVKYMSCYALLFKTSDECLFKHWVNVFCALENEKDWKHRNDSILNRYVTLRGLTNAKPVSFVF